MANCFRKKKPSRTELLRQIETLNEDNLLLEKDYRAKTEKLQSEENKNKKLENENKKLTNENKEFQAQLDVTDKLYESEKCLVENLKRKLLAFEEKYKNHQSEVEKLQRDFKLQEEKLERIKRLLEQQTLSNSSEKLSKQTSSSQENLSGKKLKCLNYKKSKSHSDLQDLELTFKRKDESEPNINKISAECQMEKEEGQNFLVNVCQENCEAQFNYTELFILYNQLYNNIMQVAEILDNNKEKEVEKLHKNTSSMEEEQEISYSEQIEKRFSVKKIIQKIPAQQTEEIVDPNIRKSLDIIEETHKNTTKLQEEVENFFGTKEDKVYLHLNEMLVRNIMKLDIIDTGGRQIIREKRKDVIQFIQRLHKELNEKVQFYESGSAGDDNTGRETSNSI